MSRDDIFFMMWYIFVEERKNTELRSVEEREYFEECENAELRSGEEQENIECENYIDDYWNMIEYPVQSLRDILS